MQNILLANHRGAFFVAKELLLLLSIYYYYYYYTIITIITILFPIHLNSHYTFVGLAKI